MVRCCPAPSESLPDSIQLCTIGKITLETVWLVGPLLCSCTTDVVRLSNMKQFREFCKTTNMKRIHQAMLLHKAWSECLIQLSSNQLAVLLSQTVKVIIEHLMLWSFLRLKTTEFDDISLSFCQNSEHLPGWMWLESAELRWFRLGAVIKA